MLGFPKQKNYHSVAQPKPHRAPLCLRGNSALRAAARVRTSIPTRNARSCKSSCLYSYLCRCPLTARQKAHVRLDARSRVFLDEKCASRKSLTLRARSASRRCRYRAVTMMASTSCGATQQQPQPWPPYAPGARHGHGSPHHHGRDGVLEDQLLLSLASSTTDTCQRNESARQFHSAQQVNGDANRSLRAVFRKES